MTGAHQRALKHVRLRVVCDSETPDARVTTLRVRVPRVLLPEINTHGLVGYSVGSSRAIPVRRRAERTAELPWVPGFRANQKGMRSGDPLPPAAAAECEKKWLALCEHAVATGVELSEMGVHKEFANRAYEPFTFVEAVWTATCWDNFWALRAHPKADPAFEFVAKACYLAVLDSRPAAIGDGWHLPFVHPADRVLARKYAREYGPKTLPPLFPGTEADWHLCRWSAARCARASYETFDGREPSVEADDRTWASLMGFDREDPAEVLKAVLGEFRDPNAWPHEPAHMSPCKHQAAAWKMGYPDRFKSNLIGVVQFRKTLPGEAVTRFNPPPEWVAAVREEIPREITGGPW